MKGPYGWCQRSKEEGLACEGIEAGGARSRRDFSCFKDLTSTGTRPAAIEGFEQSIRISLIFEKPHPDSRVECRCEEARVKSSRLVRNQDGFNPSSGGGLAGGVFKFWKYTEGRAERIHGQA